MCKKDHSKRYLASEHIPYEPLNNSVEELNEKLFIKANPNYPLETDNLVIVFFFPKQNVNKQYKF